ncbi:MAG: hypothetical protein WC856_02100 [Methylococcaceae bacterium]
MNAVLQKCHQTTLEDLHSITSLQESGAGHTLSGLQDGQTLDLFVQQAYPVSHSVLPVQEKEKTTKDICYRTLSNWSDSASLTESLVSRLKEQLGTDGSMIYKQQWKQKVTPSGIAYWAHTAWVRSIKDSDCTGWHTPVVRDYRNSLGNGTNCRDLPRQVWLVGWCTPMAQDHSRGGALPRPQDTGIPLSQQAPLAYGEKQNGSTAETISTGQLNPALSRWLMGFPEEWCEAAIIASRLMPTQRKKREA